MITLRNDAFLANVDLQDYYRINEGENPEQEEEENADYISTRCGGGDKLFNALTDGERKQE